MSIASAVTAQKEQADDASFAKVASLTCHSEREKSAFFLLSSLPVN